MNIGENIRRSRPATTTLWLLAAHVVVLSGLFTWRFSAAEGFERHREWASGEFRGGVSDYVRLYFTRFPDYYNYEWSSVILGKPLGPEYPTSERGSAELGSELLESPPEMRVPYRDVPFEYPPLLAVPLLLAGAASWSFLSFLVVFAMMATVAYLGTLWYAHEIWRRIPSERRWPWPRVLTLSLLSVGALGQLYVTRLDVFPALLFMMACADFLAGRTRRSAVWIGAGFLAKGYPIVLAPLLGLALLRQRRYRELAVATVVVIAIIGVATVGLTWLTGGAYLDSYRVHAERGLQLESTYATVALLASILLNMPAEIFVAANSWNIVIDDGGFLLTLSSILPPLAFSVIYFVSWRRTVGDGRADDPLHIVQAAVLLVLAFLLTFKVLSPQFLIWLTPLVFLAPPPQRTRYAMLVIAVFAVTQLIWPNFYYLLEQGHPTGIALLLIRNFGLGVLAVWIGWDWVRGAENDGAAALSGE